MTPEALDAIRIADKHLPDEPRERRSALAQDIVKAIMRHAEALAIRAIKDATVTMSTDKPACAEGTVAGLKAQDCPGGGLPDASEGSTVADCLAHGVCGCIYGDAVKLIEQFCCRPLAD